MQSVPLPKPLPRWVRLAEITVWEVLGFDLNRWPMRDKVRVLVAALDAELQGEDAIEDAVVKTAKKILARRRR